LAEKGDAEVQANAMAGLSKAIANRATRAFMR
jgi:hypothetical protein